MTAVAWDWANFAIRWLHVITAIAWIGESFYFIALDLGLRRPPSLPEGLSGEAWQVHGGGFYHLQKYNVAPAAMPEELHWFKWESYWTWISGFALLCVLYYADPELYLIDRHVLDLPGWGAIAIGVGVLVGGWAVYDGLCRSPLARDERLLSIAVFIFLVALAYGLTFVFSGRGAFIHVGAVIGTMMTGSVAMVIIPNQRKVVAALKSGEKPDPRLGQEAKTRSTHNNYLTLPVLFLMLSNHYPLAFSSRWNFIIIGLVIVMGVAIRHFFNTMHAQGVKLWWSWVVAAIAFILAAWLSTFPDARRDLAESGPAPAKLAAAVSRPDFAQVRDIIIGRCSLCHSQEPVREGLAAPPKGVRLDTDEEIASHARDIYLQAGIGRAMPPGNLTEITGEERAKLAQWAMASEREP
ncbi:MAG: urate hydroxylase PuuD [Hyphomicrobiales bacterium]|nr:urate hydroxylase PuuD [Hyphomicrobiales bacterium]